MNQIYSIQLKPNFETSLFDSAVRKPALSFSFLATNADEAIKIAEQVTGPLFTVIEARINDEQDDAMMPLGNDFVCFFEKMASGRRNVVGIFAPDPSKSGMAFNISKIDNIAISADFTYQFFVNRSSIFEGPGDPHMPLITVQNIDALIALDMDVVMYVSDGGNRVCSASGLPADEMRLRLML